MHKSFFKMHSNGQIGDWEISVTKNEDNTATMLRKATKVVGGKAVITPTNYTEGKNIGRSNETTPVMQAVYEAESKVLKQIDKGYVKDMPKPGDKVTNSLGFAKPMLASPIEKVKNWEFPVYVQPKYDGHRMLATVDEGGEVVLYSRQGKVLDVKEIKYALTWRLQNGYWDGTTLDGEVYCHGLTLQEISSLVKKPKPKSNDLYYCLYDVMTDEPYVERRKILTELVTTNPSKPIGMSNSGKYMLNVPTQEVHTIEELDQLHAKFLSEGYEGTIVRHGDVGYEEGKRSKSLMKKKDFQDAEFVITGWEEGKPYVKTGMTYNVPVFKCETSEGKSFSCTAPGTMIQKHELFKVANQQIGKQMTVKFFNLTPDGVPFLPVALRIREDI